MDRRELLRSTGAGAALLWLGCGGRPIATPVVEPPRLPPAALRAQLRDAVVRLRGVYAHASALAVTRTHARAALDGAARGSRRDTATSLVLAVRDERGRRRERVSRSLTAAAIEAEITALLAGRTGRATVDFDVAIDTPPGGVIGRATDGMTAVATLAARAEGAGGSRIVYRAAYVEVDDADVVLVAPGCDFHQRRVQSRAGVVLAAWRGSRLIAGEASMVVPGLLDVATLSDDALEVAAAHALEPMTPGAAPSGERKVMLAPDVVAAIAEVGVADQMTAEAWRRGAAARAVRGVAIGGDVVGIVDDPTAPTVAGYAFDDEGRRAARAVLIERGVVGTPLATTADADLGAPPAAHARRPGFAGPLAARPSHVAVAAGAVGREAMIDGIDNGLLLEGAASVRVDPATWRIRVRVARARRIERGALTGHVHADLELRAEVPALLASVSAASAETVTAGRRDEIDGEPLWRATTTPWWLARAEVVPAREPA